MTTRALVLGSGGLTGIAWEAGVLCRLDEERVDPTTWDVVIGFACAPGTARPPEAAARDLRRQARGAFPRRAGSVAERQSFASGDLWSKWATPARQ